MKTAHAAPSAIRVSAVMTRAPLAVREEASLDQAMAILEEERLRHLPVVRAGRVVGVISERDLLELTGWLHPREREALEAPAGTVRQHMHAPPICIGPEDSLARAILRLVGRGIGCLPVVEDGLLMGILSETDPLRAFLIRHRAGDLRPGFDGRLARFTTPEPIHVAPDAPLVLARDLMRLHRFHHLPVVHAGDLCGMLSERDVAGATGRGALDLETVAEAMTPDVETIDAGADVALAAERMLLFRVSALPVLDAQGRMTAIVALPDLLAACLEAL